MHFLSFVLSTSTEATEPLAGPALVAEFGNLSDYERLAEEAVRLSVPGSYKQDLMRTERIDDTVIARSLIYRVTLVGQDHPSFWVVAISTDKVPYVFRPSSGASQYGIFSKVMARDQFKFKQETIEPYIRTVLQFLAVDSRTDHISALSDIFLATRKARDQLEIYREKVKPAQLRMLDGEMTLVFYSWSLTGFLKEWNLSVKENGEITKLEIEVLARVPTIPGL
jgi:hypothetical protein